MRKNLQRLGLAALTLVALGSHLTVGLAADIIPDKTVAAATDTTFPSDVANVKALGGDGKITLSWDASTDNVAVKGYKIFYGTTSVSTDSGSYTKGPLDAGNVLTYDVKGLDNGKTYYFAVTAYDAANNESEFYSTEASATTKAGAAAGTTDTIAPKVLSATAVSKNTVSLKFSEAVKLPATKPDTAFSIKEDLVNTTLNVSKAEMDATDVSNKTVTLTTADQKKAAKYVLTVGIQLQDLAGNPIVSGTSDTAVFNGTDAVLKPAADTVKKPAADTTAPAFVDVKALDGNTVQVTFSEPVVLLSNATENFIITDTADNTKITNVKKVSVAADGMKVTVMTDDMAAQKYNLVALKVKDAAGNTMPVENSATIFDGKAASKMPDLNTLPVKDTTSLDTSKDAGKNITLPAGKPVDAASDLLAKAMAKMMINLSWKNNSAKVAGMANFVLYMSKDGGATYGDGLVLGKDAKSYDFKNLQEDMLYYFKLTTRDKSGAESEGLITYLTLPKTGPEIGFLFFGSAGLSAWLTKRKKKIAKK